MKKKYLLIGCFALSHLFSKAQTADTGFKVRKTQIDIVYNQYLQNGNNSAITGGKGTEALTIYGPSLTVKKSGIKNALKINGGIDIISSASTDNIDFVMSSPSVLDARSYLNVVYEHVFPNKELTLFGGMGCSVESDYFSLEQRIGVVKENNKDGVRYSAEIQLYNDDLRWGRLDAEVWRPVKLIYPYELRYQEWYDTYRRTSFNLKLGYSKTVNRRTVIGVYPLFSFQKGLLATPFHRIYFNDGMVAVEQLPNKRLKASVALKLNQFIGGRYILKTTLNPYIDDWGIVSLSLEHETAIKLNAQWTIMPNFRLYSQQGTGYFAPYGMHDRKADFFTSDYDLATIQTFNIGAGVRYAPFDELIKKIQLNAISLRYNYYSRSNGLNAHLLSLGIQLEK